MLQIHNQANEIVTKFITTKWWLHWFKATENTKCSCHSWWLALNPLCFLKTRWFQWSHLSLTPC